jgi:hypothetical protein
VQSYYSILSILIRPEINENISVGVLLFEKDEVVFNYSANKLKIAKELLTANSYKTIKDFLKTLESNVNKSTNSYSYRKGIKIFRDNSFLNPFTPEYIGYLSRYSNNLVSFTKPRAINIEVNQDSFNYIFYKYVDAEQKAKLLTNRVKTVEYLKEKYQEITEHYNVEREITHESVPNLITPVKIDFIGKNNIDVFIQTLDMEQHYNHIANDINAFLHLKSTYKANNMPMKDFVVAKEPSKSLSKQHDIWEQVRNLKVFEYVDISETDRIAEYTKQHNVRPFFEE